MCIVDQTGDLYCTMMGSTFHQDASDAHISANVTNIALGENYLCYVKHHLNCLDSGGANFD